MPFFVKTDKYDDMSYEEVLEIVKKKLEDFWQKKIDWAKDSPVCGAERVAYYEEKSESARLEEAMYSASKWETEVHSYLNDWMHNSLDWMESRCPGYTRTHFPDHYKEYCTNDVEEVQMNQSGQLSLF